VLSWDFNPFNCSDNQLLEYSFEFFIAFDLLSAFHIRPDLLRNFLLAVAQNYRDNPYHNFKHAFSTLHCAFMILVCGGADGPADEVTVASLEDLPSAAAPATTGPLITRTATISSTFSDGSNTSGAPEAPQVAKGLSTRYSSKYLHLADVLSVFVAAVCHDIDHPGTLI